MRERWSLHPPMRALRESMALPCSAPRGRFIQGRWSLPPPMRALRPAPRVPFVSRRKEPKACRGCAPGPPEGDASLPLRCPHPLERVCATDPDRFATLSLWANRFCFLPEIGRGHTFWFQAVARWVGFAARERLGGVAITICSHRYDTFTVTNGQTLSPSLYYYIISFI